MGKRSRAFSGGNITGLGDSTSPQPPQKRTANKNQNGQSKASSQKSSSSANDGNPVAGPSHRTRSSTDQMMNDAIDVVIGQGGQSQSFSSSDVQVEIQQLRGIILQQSQTITILTRQMSAVLAFLELSEGGSSSGTGRQSEAVGAGVVGSSEGVVAGAASTDSWVVVGGRRRTSVGRATMAAAAVAAVYCEEAERNRRATSMIVSGLPVNSVVDDKVAVVDLCRTHLGTNIDVAHTKRLGRLLPDRVQPLLVALNSSAAVQQVLTVARRLRQSSDTYIRDRVYINPNRTKAESEAAFRERESRRQAAARRPARGDVNRHVAGGSAAVVAVNRPPVLPVVPPSAPSATAGDVTASATGTSSSSAAAAAPSVGGASSSMNVAAIPSGPIGGISDVALRTQQFLSGLYQSVSADTQPPVVNTVTSDGRPA